MKRLIAIFVVLLFPALVPAQNQSVPWATSLLPCSDTSGSGTVQSCATPNKPGLSPVLGTQIIYRTSTTNTGDVTVNVNGSGPKHFRKWQGSAVLDAGDLPANKPVLAIFDGTYWEVPTIGNPPSGGSLPDCPSPYSFYLWSTSSWACQQIGFHLREVSGSSDTGGVVASDVAGQIDFTGSTAATETLPTPSTLGDPYFAVAIWNRTTGSGTTVTLFPDSWQVNGVSPFVIQQQQYCWIYKNGAGTAWVAMCHFTGGSSGSIYYQTVKANGTSQTQEPSFNLVDGTDSSVSCSDTAGVSTNCHVDVVAPSGGPGSLSECVTASGSATAYTCTASPAITSLANGQTLNVYFDVQNTGDATLLVSSIGSAVHIREQCALRTLNPGELVAGAWRILTYDTANTYWEMNDSPCQPAIPTFTWGNQGGSTATDTAGTEMMVFGAAQGTLAVRYTSSPATPYTITTQIINDFFGQTGEDVAYGIGFRQSTSGKIVNLMLDKVASSDVPYVIIEKWTSATVYGGSNYYSVNGSQYAGFVGWTAPSYACLRMRDDGTNLSFWRSYDCLNFTQISTNISRTAWFSGGPDQVGWMTESQSSPIAAAKATLMKWQVGP